MENDKKYYFYVLLCADNTLYGGFTTDPQKRLATHNAGKGAKYTKLASRRPLKMILQESFETKSEALKKEYAFKHQSRDKKIAYLKKQSVEI